MRQGLTNDWAYVGACLAHSDDNEQATIFKAFVKECQSWGTRLQIESQLAHVSLKLTSEERETLAMIGYDE